MEGLQPNGELEFLIPDKYETFYDFVDDHLKIYNTSNKNESNYSYGSEIFQLLEVCPGTDGAPVEEFLNNLPSLIEVTEGYLKVSWVKACLKRYIVQCTL